MIADPGFIDPKSLYLVAEVHNTSSTPEERLMPLTSSLHGAFQRGRLLSGQVIEDILEYSRVGEIFHKLKPKWAQEEESKLGFPIINEETWASPLDDASQPNKQRLHVDPGHYKRVWHKPIFGLFSQPKWIPTAYAPLTFEFTLQDGAQWCMTGQRTIGLPDGGGDADVDFQRSIPCRTCTSTTTSAPWIAR